MHACICTYMHTYKQVHNTCVYTLHRYIVVTESKNHIVQKLIKEKLVMFTNVLVMSSSIHSLHAQYIVTHSSKSEGDSIVIITPNPLTLVTIALTLRT